MDAAAGGRGVVVVTVTMDAAAVAAIGGRSALAAQLQAADLDRAGWAVTGPVAGSSSTTVVSASHAYISPAQASVLVAEVAGSGPGATRPFQLALSDHHTFWRTDTTLTGKVDLRCGLACFGDSGLTKALGFPTGINPASLAPAGRPQPDQVFTFSLDARLYGSLVSSNASSLQDGVLQWTPQLGKTLELTATTRSWNWTRIVALAVAAGVLVLGLLGFGAYRWRRRRRRRRSGEQGSGRATGRTRGGWHRKRRRRVSETVAPHP